MLLKGIGMHNTPSNKIKKIHIIINPASGKMGPNLTVMNTVFNEAKINWDIFITKKPHDAAILAKEAIKAKVDAIGVYGGDGTVMEVISGMMGSEIPLVILPGGTGNVLATELKIPKDLKEACELMCGTFQIKAIDIGCFNKHFFITRLGLGFESEMVKGAKREIKSKFGRLAYLFSSIKAIRKITYARYHVKIDQQEYDTEGITCIIANSGGLGFSDFSLHHEIDVSDGLLDVIIVRKVNLGLMAHILSILLHSRHPDKREVVQHWQGKDIQVSSTPKQILQCDGEMLEKISIHAKIIPAAIRVITPTA